MNNEYAHDTRIKAKIIKRFTWNRQKRPYKMHILLYRSKKNETKYQECLRRKEHFGLLCFEFWQYFNVKKWIRFGKRTCFYLQAKECTAAYNIFLFPTERAVLALSCVPFRRPHDEKVQKPSNPEGKVP
jgi:hypothetical protein